jgi:hypothetical protein
MRHTDSDKLVAEESARKSGAAQSGSRKGRLKSGELVDVTAYSRAAGFVVPVALTREAWVAHVDANCDYPLMGRARRAVERRILEILIQASKAALNATDNDVAGFSLYRLTSKHERKTFGRLAIKSDFLVLCEAGDQKEPVITISLVNS